MDILKYLKNKEVSITNDDIDIEKLTTDLRKGYVEESVANSNLNSKLEEAKKELTTKVTEMQNSYDDLNNKYTEQANRLKTANLQVAISQGGFNSTDYEKVSKLRTTYYSDIESDSEAVQKIKEEFGKVYFEDKHSKAPNESKFNDSKNKTKEPDVVITRNTSIKDLMRKNN